MNSVRKVTLGGVVLGEDKIPIQSMLNTDPHDIPASIAQIDSLYQAGCDIVRMAVPDMQAVAVLSKIKEKCPMPLVADIHFDYRLAIESVNAGADKIRINPGNIGTKDRVKAVVDACRTKGVPIRVGVNSGSLEKELLAKYGKPCAEALAESAINNALLLESMDFEDIVLSVKSSDVKEMVQANRLIRIRSSYPLHLGVTEAGMPASGMVKSSIGIGSLLLDHIGETIRVSLTADPVEEVLCAIRILSSLGLKKDCVKIISCPTCGRTKVDLISLAQQAEKMFANVKKDITVAIMGCCVNGPGEAKQADVGLAGGKDEYILFKKGEPLCKVKPQEALARLAQEIEKL